MIGRDIVELLKSEAKRRPVVADLLARVDQLTDAEIEAAPVPMKWYKDALKEARKRIQSTTLAQQIAEFAADNPLDPNDVIPGENTKRGITLEYTGGNFWTRTRTGAEFEIQTGDWLFFPEDGGCWLNQTFFPNPSMKFSQSKKIAEHTRYDYVLAYKDRWNKYPGFEDVFEDKPDRAPRKGFSIYKTPGNYW